jgi:hypothetical protein
MTNAGDSKCGKAPGEYCRIHNPEPSQGHIIAESTTERTSSQISTHQSQSNFSSQLGFAALSSSAFFQQPGQIRKLAADVPYELKNHIDDNYNEAERIFRKYPDERYALMHYARVGSGAALSEMFWQQQDEYKYDFTAENWRAKADINGFSSREELVSYLHSLDSALSTRSHVKRIVYHGMSLAHVQRQMQDLTGKSPSPKDRTTWQQGLQELYAPGRIIDFKGYLSTSRSAHLSGGWATDRASSNAPIHGVVFELKTNAGVDITGLSNDKFPYSTEREILLPRETRFKVVDVDIYPAEYRTEAGIEEPNPWKDNYNQTKENYRNLSAIVQLIEVDRDGKPIHNPKDRHVPSISVEGAVPQLTQAQKKEAAQYKRKGRWSGLRKRLGF